MAGRPDRLVAVVGTGTEVGKTWVASRLVGILAATGHRVWARKPAQSFDPGDDPASTDAAVLAAATGELASAVCPEHRWYPLAMAPPMAAAALGRPSFTLGDLAAEITWPHAGPPSGGDHPEGSAESVGVVSVGVVSVGVVSVGVVSVGVVETAGGVRSPQADDGDGVALLGLLDPDVVILVADAGLGTIHSVRACLDALAPTGSGVGPSPHPRGVAATAPPVVVVLNRFDPASDLHVANRDWLERRDGYYVVVTPGEEDVLAARVLG
ncbi:MAG: hypothetical protein ACYDHU_11175 [Acidimicrobiales bacterium]